MKAQTSAHKDAQKKFTQTVEPVYGKDQIARLLEYWWRSRTLRRGSWRNCWPRLKEIVL